ncbi:HD family phosphohydrolase [Clostridium sp. E02]|uniref:HD family phosphohydrolase n=1 Tax=Clostridium sp. E02 TaxID=2487134 RepID=UPI000F51D898|nr:HD family phosphohydrolase [Clostridium sp. E02]
MKNKHMTRKERQELIHWAEDSFWVEQKNYSDDPVYMDCVKDILDNKVFQSMEGFLQHGDTTCKAHCIKVSYMSYCILRKLGWEYKEAARAGLLHDLFLYDWHTHAKETGEHFHGLTHPRTALNNAEKYFELTRREKNMILRHMWPLTPIPPSSRGGFVIVYSDKFCGAIETMARIKRWILFGFGIKGAV